jgi:hypothetical protein
MYSRLSLKTELICGSSPLERHQTIGVLCFLEANLLYTWLLGISEFTTD